MFKVVPKPEVQLNLDDALLPDNLGTQLGKTWETERLFQIMDRHFNLGQSTSVTP
jgi:hypothetical protein